MNEILKEVWKQKEFIEKSFEFKLWNKDHQSIFLQGYDSAMNTIIDLLKKNLDNEFKDSNNNTKNNGCYKYISEDSYRRCGKWYSGYQCFCQKCLIKVQEDEDNGN